MNAKRESRMFAPETIREMLSYDPSGGVLRWKHRPRHHFETDRSMNHFNASLPGKVAGTLSKNGYITLRMAGANYYLAHRIAWAVHYGVWPKYQIDHKNGVRSDNRIENLREASHAENCRNIGITKANKSGVVGVSRMHNGEAWRARIKVDRKNIHIGTFKDFSDAVAARKSAEQLLHKEFAGSNR